MNSLFSQLSGASLLAGHGANTSLGDLIDGAPGLGFLQKYVSTWVKLDITTIAACMAIFGMISSTIPLIRSGWVRAYWWITRFFTASISIASNDRLNREVLNWLGTQVLPRQATRVLTARSEALHSDAHYMYRRQHRSRDDSRLDKMPPIQYLPTFGTTWFIHDRNVFIVRRICSSSSYVLDVPNEYAAAPEGREPLIVMCLGRSVKPVKRFLDTCREFAYRQRHAYVTVRACKRNYGEQTWDTTILRPLRPLATVHFDEQAKAELVADIKNYLDPATQRFYQARGIPYRRGYLLHGPAGTGKTSLSLALAGYFGLELYLLHVPSVQGDDEMESLFTTLPPRCFILLEDIDAVGIKRRIGPGADDDDDDDDEDDDDDSSRRGYRCRATLSGLLNVIDGVASQEGRIVLMTSNFAEKLDRALVRPGRIDKKIFLGFISQESARLMFQRMYVPDADSALDGLDLGVSDEKLEQLALDFSSQIPDSVFTPAQLQGYLLSFRNEPARAAAEVGPWVAEERTRMDEAKRLAQKAAEARKKRRAKFRVVISPDAAQKLTAEAAKPVAAADQTGHDSPDTQTDATASGDESSGEQEKSNHQPAKSEPEKVGADASRA